MRRGLGWRVGAGDARAATMHPCSMHLTMLHGSRMQGLLLYWDSNRVEHVPCYLH